MKLFFTVLITLVLGLMVLSIRDSVFLSGGSDALDIVTLPEPASQAIALGLFFFSIVHMSVKYPNKHLGNILKLFFFVPAFIIMLASGHTYTISGKQHAIIDQWFHVPLQKLEFDPTKSIERYKYTYSDFFITIYDGNVIKQKIFKGPLLWGIKGDKIIASLENFGIEKHYDANKTLKHSE